MAKARVLVVEDEQIVALDIQAQLADLGYRVIGVASYGEDAIRAAIEGHPDIVLMDINLRGEMDGIEAAQHIRRHLDIPVIYVTAYADQSTLERAKITEAFGYLLKPFEARELHTTIEMGLYKHRMERELKQQQQWLSATLASIGDAVIATDSQGQVKFMNSLAEELTGWKQREASGSDLRQVFRLIDQEMRQPVESPTEKLLAKGIKAQPQQAKILVARDGREIPIDHSVDPIRDEKEQVNGVVLVFRDVTERRAAQEKLRQYASELEQRNRELDAFAHTVAHDLKDPLSTMITCATMLEDQFETLSDAQTEKLLRLLVQVGFDSCNIIDELLLLAAVRSAEVCTVPLHMASIVHKAERRLTFMKQEFQAEIARPAEWPVALGYGPWVEEVWVNYLSNGIKYGGDPPRLELGATELPGGMVRFWVRDNGAGIDDVDQNRLFTPFAQLGEIRATGHGLGLSIVQRIVEKLGGKVGVESKPGRGSVFAFELPAA